MTGRSPHLIALLVVCIFFISPVMAQDNPYKHTGDITDKDIAVNVESGIAKVSDSSNVTFSGAEYTHTLGRVSIRMKPLMDGINERVISKGNIHISGVKSQVKYSVYRNLIKEEITLKSPETVRYSYDLWLSDWVTKIPDKSMFQKLHGRNKTENLSQFSEKTVISYARDNTIDIQPDRWGNLVVYVNGKDVVVMPRPFAIDATGKRFDLGFDLDKKNKIISITGDLTGAQYPIVIDPTERVTNGNFETGDFTGWTFSVAPDEERWWADVDTEGDPHNGYLTMYWEDDVICMQQSVDLTNVDNLTFDAEIFEGRWSGEPPYGVFRVFVDDDLKLTVDEDVESWTDYEVNVSGYTGVHTLKFCLTGGYYQCAFFITGISAIGSDVPPAPVTDFKATPHSGTVPLTVTFTDNSTGLPTSWIWDFGDGQTSTQQNPSHTYTISGKYNVSLTSTNAAGSNTVLKIRYINVTSGAGLPIVKFTANISTGYSPLAVKFTDRSTGTSLNRWNWSFGNGIWFNTTVASQKSPLYVYSTPGNYTAVLTVCNVSGCNTTVPGMAIAVKLLTPPIVKFTTNVSSGFAPLNVKFTDQSTGNPTQWNWNFGDGIWFNTTSSSLKSPSYVYTTPRNYSTYLMTCNAAGCNITSPGKIITAKFRALPIAGFTTNVTSGNTPVSVKFTDTSTGKSLNKWNWSFGDGSWFNTTVAAQKNPTHVYSSSGTYLAALTVSNSSGTNTTVPGTMITVTETCPYTCDATLTNPPYIDFVIDRMSCPEDNSGEWWNATCLNNAVIRWSRAGNSASFHAKLSPWMWKRSACCPDPGYSWAFDSPANKPVYIAGLYNSQIDGKVFSHAIAAELLTTDSPENSTWQSWRFFNYENISIPIGNWQIPVGTESEWTHVWIKSVDVFYQCGQQNGQPVMEFYIAPNGTPFDHNRDWYTTSYLKSQTLETQLQKQNIPDEVNTVIELMKSNRPFSINKWEVNTTKKELVIYAYDIKDEQAIDSYERKPVSKYSIRVIHDAEFETGQKDVSNYLWNLRKYPDYQINSVYMVADRLNDQPENIAEVWVYKPTSENMKLDNTIIQGWKIKVYPVDI